MTPDGVGQSTTRGTPIQRTPPTPLPSAGLGTIAGIALCGLVPVLIVYATPGGGHSAWWGALLVMCLTGLRYSWIIASQQRRLFEMVTWLFAYVFLGIAPLVQMRRQVDPDTTPNILHEFDWSAVVIVLVGCTALIAGSSMAKHSSRFAVRPASRGLSSTRTSQLSFVAVSFGLVYVALVGPATFLGSRNGLDIARGAIWHDPTTAALVTGIVNMSLLVAVVAQLQRRRIRRLNGGRAPLALLCLTMIVLFVCVNPISSPRYVFGTVILGVLAAAGAYSSLGKFRAVAAMALIGLVFLFPLADLFRSSLDATFATENPLDSMLSGDFDSFAQINNTALFVDRNGLTWGAQGLGVLLFWVPRAFWPNKPTDTGIVLANSREYGFTNLSAPLWSELYINGGWVVLVLGMVALGFALRRADAGTEVQLALAGVPSVVGCIVPFYLMIVLRGSLLQSVSSLAVVLALAWFVSWRTRTELRDAATPATTVRGPHAARSPKV